MASQLKPGESLPANSDKITYCVSFNAAPTAAMDLVTIKPGMGGGGLGSVVRLRKLVITNPGAQTAAGVNVIQVGVATTNGSGGSAGGAVPYGFAESEPGGGTTFATSFSGIVRKGDTTVAASANIVFEVPVFVPAAAAVASPIVVEFNTGGGKCPVAKAGVTGGATLVVRHPGAAGAAGFAGYIEFTVEAE